MTKTVPSILFSCAALLASAAPAVQITEFPLPDSTSTPSRIVAGPDGALWFTEKGADRIGRITTSGVVTEFPVTAGSQPDAITAGPDGALWYTESGASKIGRITTAGVVTDFAVAPGAVLLAIASGTDGNIWFSYELLVPGPGPLGRFGYMTPGGAITELDMPFPVHVITALAAGPDGRMWFTGNGYGNSIPPIGSFGAIGSISAAGNDASVTLLSTGIPAAISAGPDGRVWFTANIPTSFGDRPSEPSPVGKIGRADTGLYVNLAEFATPSRSGALTTITAGPDGNVWYSAESPRVGRVTPDGAITEIAESSPDGGHVVCPDGSVWFTEPGTGRIARISSLSTICTPSVTALCFDNGRFRVEATWTKSDGTTGPAIAAPLGTTSSAGYLWFFSPETPEVTVKTIEGCSFNGNVWFFAGGLTNVRVDVKVTDITVPNGAASKTYTNPLGTPFAPIQDTAAFPCLASPIPPGPQKR